MKRKTYATVYERKIDRLLGFVLSLLINGALLLHTYTSPPSVAVSQLPWLVNGALIVLTCAFRPQMLYGYVASIFVAAIAVTVLGVVLAAACTTSTAGGLLSWFLLGEGCASVLSILLFFGVVLGGLFLLGRRGNNWLVDWWPSHQDKLWRVSGELFVYTLQAHTGAVRSLAFAPDGEMLASASSDNTPRLWELQDGPTLKRTLQGHTGAVHSLAFAPDGSKFASASADGTVKVWSTWFGAHEYTLTRHAGGVNAVAFSPNGKLLATGADDGAARLWRESDQELLHTLEHPAAVRSLAFAPNGATLAVAAGDTLWLWKVADGTLTGTLQGHAGNVTCLAFLPYKSYLASGHADSAVRLWHWPDKTCLRILAGHTGAVNSLAFAPGRIDPLRLVSASADGTVHLWHPESGALLRELQEHNNPVTSVAACAETITLASGSADGIVRLWRE